MSEILVVSANSEGRLQLSIKTESVKIDTEWTGLTNPQIGMLVFRYIFSFSTSYAPLAREEEPTESQTAPSDKMFRVLVSVKSFIKFLNSHVVSTTTIACECPLFSSTSPALLPDPGLLTIDRFFFGFF